MNKRKAVYQHIFNSAADLPVKTNWMRGKFSGSHGLTYHRALEFQYIKRGKGSYLIKNLNYPFHKNSLLIMKPQEIHSFLPNPESYIEKCALMFNRVLLEEKPSLYCFPPDFPCHICLSEKEAIEIDVILNNINEEMNKRQKYYAEIIYADVIKFLSLIRRCALQPVPPPKKNPTVQQMTDYIEGNFAQDISIAFLAKQLSFSPSRLSHLFKQYTGLSIKKYVIQRRIVEAKKIIEEHPKLQVFIIGNRVGFKSFNLFNHHFKIITGFTPGNYCRIFHQENKTP